MGSDLSCFDWTNQSSAFLDGSLSPGLQKSAESHLDQCKDCRERHARYRLILDSLRGLPRNPAPATLKYEREVRDQKKPARAAKTWRRHDRLIRLILRPLQDLTPRTWTWISISVLGFIALTSLPKLQALYEARLQRRLEAVNFEEMPITPVTGEGSSADDPSAHVDDFSGDEGEDENASMSAETQGTGSSREGEWNPSQDLSGSETSGFQGAQVWRFILRTDSPQDLRAKVHQALLKGGVSPQAKMIHGFVAPGGIQFDVLAPATSIPELRETLEQLSEEHSPSEDPGKADNPYPSKPFTWYRNRSKRPLPKGAARVVIWLSLT